MIKKNP